MDSYVASNVSCFMVTWTIFQNHLLEVGLTRNWETIDSRTCRRYAPPRLRPRPPAQRSGASLGAPEGGLARAPWAGGASHPLPRVGATLNGQVRKFFGAAPLRFSAESRGLELTFSGILIFAATPFRFPQGEFLNLFNFFFRCGSSLDLVYVYMFMINRLYSSCFFV